MRKRLVLILSILLIMIMLVSVFISCDKEKLKDETPSGSLSGTVIPPNDVEDSGSESGTILPPDDNKEGESGDEKVKITAIQGGTVNGLELNLEIGDTVEYVALSDMITTSKDCSWQLYMSPTATAADAIVTKMIVPKNGANTYYIVVTSSDGKLNRTYTLNVWKNYFAKLSFYIDDILYDTEEVLTHTTYGDGPNYEKEGYDFSGWDCKNHYVKEDTSFHATLTPRQYTITFNSNGGENVSSRTATFDDSTWLPIVSRTGYTFKGWRYNGETYNDSMTYTFPKDITMSAEWQINSYNVKTISEDINKGSVIIINEEKTYGSSVNLQATTNIGYTFIGWFDGINKISDELNYTTTVPAYNVTYTAKWQVSEEMSNFNFTSSPTTCSITGVKDKHVTQIVIPQYVTSIGDYAFESCVNLTSITIPDSVTSIGNGAFNGCGKLIEVINLSSLEITKGSSDNGLVGYYALNIKTSGETDIVNIDDYLFYTYGDTNYLLGYIGEDAKLVLPNDYKGTTYEIYQYAFSGCSSLESITIPNSVKSIGSSAFRNCSSLTSVTIGDSVTSIGNQAFFKCSSLTSITIGNSVTSIGNDAFRYCSSLTSITIPDSVTSIGYDAFEDCSSLTSINFEGTVAQWEDIAKDWFWNSNTGSYTIHCTDGDIAKS